MNDLSIIKSDSFLIWNINEGKPHSPVRTAYCFILSLRIVYGLILVLRNAYV